MNKLKNAYKRSPALFSIILCFTLVFASAAVYFGIGLLPRNARTYDATPNRLYTLHSETLDLLSSLDKDVEVILISETGIPEYGIPETFLLNYAEKSDRIKLSVVAPEAVADTYGSLNEGCAIIKSEYRETVIYSSDYFDTSDEYFDISYNYYHYLSQQGYDVGSYADFMYSGYGESLQLFDIAKYESTLTNAINYVASEDITTIYSITGHGETTLDVYLYPELRLNHVELLFGKIATGIPENADGVLINNPTSDITEDDKTALSEYLANGGDLTVITSYTTIKKLTNLLAICEEYGLTTDGGFLCDDTEGYNYQNYPDVTIPTVNVEAFGGYLSDAELKPLLSAGTGITVTEKADVTVKELLKTSPNAYAKLDAENAISSEFNAETDVRKQYSSAAIAENSANGSTVLWIPTIALGDSTYDTASSRNNFPVFIAALNAQYKTVRPIDIPGTSIITEPTQAPESAFALGMVVAIAVPCIIMAIGGIFLLNRRKHNA